MYRLMNSMDSLLRFEGLAKGNSPRIQDRINGVPSATERLISSLGIF
jgi:hypothetical protein